LKKPRPVYRPVGHRAVTGILLSDFAGHPTNLVASPDIVRVAAHPTVDAEAMCDKHC
jgi:hypothetical protein